MEISHGEGEKVLYPNECEGGERAHFPGGREEQGMGLVAVEKKQITRARYGRKGKRGAGGSNPLEGFLRFGKSAQERD